MVKNIIAEIDDIDVRLDLFLAKKFDLTRSSIQKIIEKSQVKINNLIKTENKYKIKLGDFVEIELAEPREIAMKAQDLGLDILYEDEHIIVINKRQGMMVHPAQENYSDTLVNALLFHCKGSLSGINGEIRPGIVHRLDKNTSGVMIAAKSNEAHLKLAEQIKKHDFTRVYRGIVFGKLKENLGTINLPLGRSSKDFKKIAVYKSIETNSEKKNRQAITHYKVLEEYSFKNNKYSQIEFKLETGRTHQIRVHSAFLGHPIIGDPLYGREDINKNFTFLNGQCLHSKSIKFEHPISGETIFIESELPEYFKKVLNLFN